MFGDHHVMEVRRLLLEMPGVEDVYASSCFQVVEVQYDETSLKPEEIEVKLGEAGYLGEMPMPAETGVPVGQEGGDKPFYRHTAHRFYSKSTRYRPATLALPRYGTHS
jgi:copper chaperone CopZ